MASGTLEDGRVYDLVKEPGASRAAGVQPPAIENQVERPLQADQPRQSLGASASRQQAEVDLRLAEAHARQVGGHAVIARQRQLEAASQRCAVDCRHGGTRQPRQLFEHRLKAAHDGFCLLRIGGPGDYLQVRARYPLVRLVGNQDQAAEAV